MENHSDTQQPIGVGHGLQGRYGGLSDDFSSLQAKIIILPVPFEKTTTYQQGTAKGPDSIIEASRNLELYDIETDFEVFRLGIHTASPVHEKTSMSMLTHLEQRVTHYLNQEKFVVTLGGEHSISIAPIKAFAKHYPNLSVVQLDAHADLQVAYEGNAYSHASTMARVKEVEGIANVTAVGVRSLSKEELIFIDREHTYFGQDLWNREDWIDDVIAGLTQNVYVTLDLDVLDPSIMPSTGTPEPGGLGWYQTLHFLKKLSREKTIVGFDCVELCPNPLNKAPDFLAAKLVYKFLSYIFTPQEDFEDDE